MKNPIAVTHSVTQNILKAKAREDRFMLPIYITSPRLPMSIATNQIIVGYIEFVMQ